MTDDKGKLVLEKPKAIVFKLMGVICKFSFGTKLIDYSIENCANFLNKHFLDPEILRLMPKLKKYYEHIKNPDCPSVSWSSIDDLLSLEDENARKTQLTNSNPVVSDFKKNLTNFLIWAFRTAESDSPVNEIQNCLWLDAYSTNQLKSEFYEDVPDKLREWKEASIKLFSFSSGTVYGQQAYFQNSTAGNLLDILDGQITSNYMHLDKKDTQCYRKISEIINEERKSILFISPNLKELKAAAITGLRTCLMKRERKREEYGESSFKSCINIIHELNDLVFK